MAKRIKKEQTPLSVSYLDVFFILLAGCILSLGIYLSTEENETVPEYRVEATADYRAEILGVFPEAGDALFDISGQRIGQLQEVELYEINGRPKVLLTFLLKGEAPLPGDAFAVETVDSYVTAEILSITEQERGE